MRIMSDLIVSPFLGEYLVVRPGHKRAVKISGTQYREIAQTPVLPAWFNQLCIQAWDCERGSITVRSEAILGCGKASYELNLGCNYDCEHCYLGLKQFEGLNWPNREILMEYMRDAGVLWLQLTGGEPMIDKLFADVYAKAHELGMMIEILTNGSRLGDPRVLSMLTARKPSRVIVSIYGATEESYDGLTRRPGSYRKFIRALTAANEAGIRLELSLIITARNEHEKAQMRDLARRFGRISGEYGNISPTIYGGAGNLPSQSPQFLRTRKPFTGCSAGHTSFHVDPFGKASICKIGREPHIDLLTEGPFALARLGKIGNDLLLRQEGCTGCALQGTCGTCMPLVQLHRKANAPLSTYCQHQEPREEVRA